MKIEEFNKLIGTPPTGMRPIDWDNPFPINDDGDVGRASLNIANHAFELGASKMYECTSGPRIADLETAVTDLAAIEEKQADRIDKQSDLISALARRVIELTKVFRSMQTTIKNIQDTISHILSILDRMTQHRKRRH